MSMKVLIVEDETAAHINLTAILKEIDPDIEVVGITESVAQTVRWFLKNPPPDLIFMDIHLSDGSAFNIFQALTIDTPVIFTTAYDQYAIDAFKVNSIDYLLKPIEEKDVIKALDKFKRLSQNETSDYISQVAELVKSGKYPRKILLPINDKLLPVEVSEIACFYNTNDHTVILMNDGISYPFVKSLDMIFQTLDPNDFFRANRQFIIARKAVTDITIWFDNRLLVKLGVDTEERIYISKNKASQFRQWLVM